MKCLHSSVLGSQNKVEPLSATEKDLLWKNSLLGDWNVDSFILIQRADRPGNHSYLEYMETCPRTDHGVSRGEK